MKLQAPQETAGEGARDTRGIGGLLIVAATLEAAAMAHHPTVTAPDIAGAIVQIGRMSSLSAVVHGVLIGLMLCILWALAEWCRTRGPQRPMMRAGFIAYLAGVVTMIFAAIMSGFVITQFARLAPHVSDIDLQINAQMLLLCRLLNQAFANVATVLMSTAILLWSIDLLRGSAASRAVGALGCVIALLASLALMSGLLHLDIHGMLGVVVLQSIWYIAIGLLILRRIV